MKRILYIFLAGTMILAGSCSDDYLNPQPTDAVPASEAFSTAERVNASMNGLYDLITTSSFNSTISLTQDIKGGDMVLVSSGNYSRFVTEYQFIQSPFLGYGEGFFEDGYKLIANTNVAIRELPNSPIDEDVKNDYLAEARALRAWGHLTLVHLFAQPFAVNSAAQGIPYMLTPLGAGEQPPARGTVKENYDKLVEDLVFAQENIDPARDGSDGRLTLNAVNGLLARVYLDMGQWRLAADHAKLARADYPLSSGASLLNGFVDPTSEWIWTLVYRSDDNTGYVQIASFQEPYDIGYSTFRANTAFVDMFAANDIRSQQFLVNPALVANPASGANPLLRQQKVYSRNGYLMNKFYFRGSWDLNVPMMRSAEMWLIEAEAESELNNWTAAQDALFAVQARAITGAVKSVNTGQALKDEIRDERRKELFGEGFRFYDIFRRKETLTRVGPDHWAPNTIAPGDKLSILPIPQREVDLGLVEQTDEWK